MAGCGRGGRLVEKGVAGGRSGERTVKQRENGTPHSPKSFHAAAAAPPPPLLFKLKPG